MFSLNKTEETYEVPQCSWEIPTFQLLIAVIDFKFAIVKAIEQEFSVTKCN